MKVVLDTNVIVSGIYYSGIPYLILRAWQENRFQLSITSEIYSEYRQVMQILSTAHPGIEISSVLDYIAQKAVFYSAPFLSEQVCDDPDDDKFLACALASGSEIIVSGDKHLLKISGFHNIYVCKPKDFFDNYLST